MTAATATLIGVFRLDLLAVLAAMIAASLVLNGRAR